MHLGLITKPEMAEKRRNMSAKRFNEADIDFDAIDGEMAKLVPPKLSLTDVLDRLRRRSTAAPAAPTSCSTSSPGSASRHRRRPSRRPRACSFATGQWPTVSATTA